jgi:tetratricopeptide (TPR) repeat protein
VIRRVIPGRGDRSGVAATIALVALLTHPALGASREDRFECGLTGDAAIAACNRVINDRNEAPRGRAEAFFYRGSNYSMKNEYDRAIGDYTEAIRLDPKMANAYYFRGIAWSIKNNLDRAIADFNQSISLDPNNAGAWDLRCLDRAKANRDLPQALVDCNESLRLSPNDAGAHGSRGFVYLRLNRLDEAIADFEAALKPRPNTYWLYARGIAKLRKGDTGGVNADIMAAKGYKADIAEEFARWGVK